MGSRSELAFREASALWFFNGVSASLKQHLIQNLDACQSLSCADLSFN